MKPKFQVILELALREGIELGWRRAHKHLENPSEYVIKDNIEQHIMEKFYEYFDFEEFNEN